MSRIRLEQISKVFGRGDRVRAIDNLTLTIEQGEFLVLLGPSGCGKTTLLRCVAGLERPDSGRIVAGDLCLFDDRNNAELETYRRDIGMVFQNYTLWPHMTVLENVAFPLECRGVRKAQRMQRAAEALNLVECASIADRLPAGISGGQQQRVALARAVVAEPRIMLFDEPLSNLDFRLRAQLRADIRAVHRRLRFTGIYVTHDQTEALELGTTIAVMRSGKIEQLGTPEQIFGSPGTPYVAEFLGISNKIAASRQGSTWSISGIQTPIELPSSILPDLAYDIYIRSSDLRLVAKDHSGSLDRSTHVIFPDVEITDAAYGGDTMELTVRLDDLRFKVTMAVASCGYRVGDRVDMIAPVSTLLSYTRTAGSRAGL